MARFSPYHKNYKGKKVKHISENPLAWILLGICQILLIFC